MIIGGGPAGMFCARTAAAGGAQVLLIEKNALLGRKLRITGKGRCNVTNDCSEAEFLQHVPTNPKFLYSALHRFSPQDTKAYFEARGVNLKTERGNRVFPLSDRAADIANALAEDLKENGVTVLQGEVSSLFTEDGRCAGVKLANGQLIFARSVVVATGGKSYPLTGSTGDGYLFAEQAGHTVRPLRPSLVPLVSSDPCCGDMQGLSLRNIRLSLWDKRKQSACYEELGEMLFTHFGVSGPLVLSASAHIPQMEENRYELHLDFKPALDEPRLDARILRDFAAFSNRQFANSLEKLLPRKLIPTVIARSGIPPMTKVNQIGREQRKALCSLLKRFVIPIDGFRPIEEAIVTSGGVSVSEVNPKTMESKKMPGLFFIGEVLDLDGYTGGFNLQIAFSTAYAAGVALSQENNP